jgi:UDP-N-acetylglucosamine 2-epimerase (non-hydrolysing)
LKNIAVVFGTRPEAIKLCPLIEALQALSGVRVEVCLTGQHREMVQQVLQVFGVAPTINLNLMTHDQPLAEFSARAVLAINQYISNKRFDCVVVQGDTTTAFCAALASFYQRIPVAHVEAGLRSGRMDSPFPEEMNRVFISRLASMHFAPTALARENLLREGVPDATIHVTGNTVVDALQKAVALARLRRITIRGLPPDIAGPDPRRPIVLVTGHRRESFGVGFENICLAICDLARIFPHLAFVYPVHLNPNVRAPVNAILSKQPGIFLLEPLDYLSFVTLMDRSLLIMSDSGGIQEEAPTLGKRVLVMREVTERTEAIEAGTAILVGTERENIVAHATTELTRLVASTDTHQLANPFGDGLASERIASLLGRDRHGA